MAEVLGSFESDGSSMWVRDGLVFANLGQTYAEGVNPLSLQWRDPICSLFGAAPSPSHNGLILNVCMSSEQDSFKTLDEEAITMTNEC